MDQKLGYIYCLFNIFRVGRAAERARRHPRETNTRNVTIWSGNCWEITSNSVQENILLYYNRKYFISTRIMLSFLSDTPLDSAPFLLPGSRPGNLLKCRYNSHLKIFLHIFFPNCNSYTVADTISSLGHRWRASTLHLSAATITITISQALNTQ